MICKFQDSAETIFNKQMFVEIQFRTRLQHSWATAVEIMGLYTKSNLKSSQGDKSILRFFTLISSIFAIKEGRPVCPDTPDTEQELVSEIKQLQKEYGITEILRGLRFAINCDKYDTGEVSDYYLLILDYDNREVHVKGFKSSQLAAATEVYNKIENETDMNVVLVSANSLAELREAYPNYLIDVSMFISEVNRFLQKPAIGFVRGTGRPERIVL